MLHRSPGYTLVCYAEFEAIKPGRFNLEVSSVPSDPKIAITGVPIIVVARDTPITMIAGHEEVRGFSMGYDGREYVSSTSGNSYMTNVMILQPGDRISLVYYSVVHRQESFASGRAQSDKDENLKPFIRRHGFGIDLNYNFNEWLISYLPK